MKKILILVVLLFSMVLCLASCNSAKYNDALALIEAGKYTEAYGLLKELGNYKDAEQLLDRFYYVPSGSVFDRDDDVLSAEFFYDENNLPLRTVLTDTTGGTYTVDYTYDANSDLVKEVFVDSEGVVSTYTYTYDANRNQTRAVYEYGVDESYSYTEDFEYDEYGRMTKKTTVYSGLEYSEVYTYTYDEKGNVVQEVLTPSEGDTLTTVYTYDENGKKIQGVSTSANGEHFATNYTYDANGNLSKEAYVYGEETGEMFAYVYEYDANSNVTKKTYVDNGEVVRSYDYTYDANGNRIKTVHTDGEGNVENKEVEYKLVYVSKDVTDQIKKVYGFDYY